MNFSKDNYWAIILGGSSGFGLATAKELASRGMNICLVHRDRRGAMARIEEEFKDIKKHDVSFLTYNLDALSSEGRASVLDGLAQSLNGGKVRMLLHSIAFGSLKLIAPSVKGVDSLGSEDELLLDEEDLQNTILAMGTSLLTWTQDIFKRGIFANDSRVIGLTSEGNEVAWPAYAAVSAAKSVLESVSRSIATEFGRHGIRSNIVQPGVTDTPALRLIPGSQKMMDDAIKRNPLGRLTLAEDVAKVIAFLASDDAAWVNGSIIRADGGERISGL